MTLIVVEGRSHTMKSRLISAVALLLGIAAYFILFRSAGQEATLVLLNGRVYTLDERNTVAEAVAIRGDVIVGVGSTAEIEHGFKAAKTIDLNGLPVYPGFVDAHAHLEGLGAAMLSLTLAGVSSIEEVQSAVRSRLESVGPEEWIRGRGWDQNLWPGKAFPTHQMLDAVSREVPVYLTRIDGHAVWVNRKVLEISGVTRTTPDPEGGKIIRDKFGNPTGVFVDNAIDLLNSVLPPLSMEERTKAVELAIEACLSVGLTEVHDMGVLLDGIAIYKQLIDTGRFPFRVYAAIDGIGDTWDYYLENGPELNYGDNQLIVRAMKIYADGALGSRGAALIEPYSDDPGNRGLTLTALTEMNSVIKQALEAGFQVCTHAIGDRGNHIVLNAYENGFKSLKRNGREVRFRVEHAQIVDPVDIPRFSALGVIPSMQPTHCTSDMYWVGDRLGSDRLAGAYAWRTFLEHGSIIPGGSDFPVEGVNPLWGIYAAITRQDHSGWPEGGWRPEQSMTRLEALRAFTTWAAYASFKEKQKGTVENGKLADLVILSDDIMEIPPQTILATSVRYTIVGGRVVYAADAGSGQ